MRLVVITLWTSAIAVTATAALAQPYSANADGTHGARNVTAPAYGRPGEPNRYVIPPGGPYGRPGEPLGPAFWGQSPPTNPRACGPGACQDDPRY